MAYTASGLRQKGNQTFGSLVQDQNRVEMTGYSANFTISQDATASPVTSPVTNMSASGATLTIPANAVSVTISSTVATQVGEDSSYAQGLNIPANNMYTYPCARQAFVYLKPSSGTNTTTFQFNCV